MEIIMGTDVPHLFSDFFAALYQSFFSPKISQILFGFDGGVVAQPLKKVTQNSKQNTANNFIQVIVHVVLPHAVPIVPINLLR